MLAGDLKVEIFDRKSKTCLLRHAGIKVDSGCYDG